MTWSFTHNLEPEAVSNVGLTQQKHRKKDKDHWTAIIDCNYKDFNFLLLSLSYIMCKDELI